MTASTGPQEPVDNPTQEKSPIKEEYLAQGNEDDEEEYSYFSPKTT
jgi:hypothetical protein